MKQLRPEELARWLAERRPVRILDVREDPEWDLVRLPGAEHFPLSDAAAWIPRICAAPGEAPIVVYCHHGVRSARACGLLERAGLASAWNLSGGIDAWSQSVDARLPRY